MTERESPTLGLRSLSAKKEASVRVTTGVTLLARGACEPLPPVTSQDSADRAIRIG
jgi:hypothetical protein